jgi:hypothetical protein
VEQLVTVTCSEHMEGVEIVSQKGGRWCGGLGLNSGPRWLGKCSTPWGHAPKSFCFVLFLRTVLADFSLISLQLGILLPLPPKSTLAQEGRIGVWCSPWRVL